MRKPLLAAALASGVLLLAGCTTNPGTTPGAVPGDTASSTASETAVTKSDTLTVLTHESFKLSDELKASFEKETGIKVTYLQPGNAGTLVNKLILTKDSPLGDVVFGVDNTFGGKAIAAGIFDPYVTAKLSTDVAAKYAADDSGSLTPIDFGDVCMNIDKKWFAKNKLAEPQTLDDLTKSEYKDLLVVMNPASSSPGLAFLAATVGAKGESGYLEYWQKLKDNGVKVVAGWEDGYYVDFSGSSGKGSRPIILSYASSPMYEDKEGESSVTAALPATCFRQVEYAGVIAGSQNVTGARAFIDFLLSDAAQSAIPDAMYMTPVLPTAKVPAEWEKYTGVVTDPIKVDAATISAQSEQWIKAWTDLVIG